MINRATVAKLIAHYFPNSADEAESLADGMMRDDFKINGIKTMGGVIAYFEYVKSLKKSWGIAS